MDHRFNPNDPAHCDTCFKEGEARLSADVRPLDATMTPLQKRNTSFTPGPWVVVDDEIVARDTEQRIADVPLLDGIDPTEWHANAHLIAAAPELLAALKDVIDTLQREAPGTPLNNHRFDALGIQAHKAIAKAEAR